MKTWLPRLRSSLRFTDKQRRLLAAKDKDLGRAALKKLDTLVTPDTLLRRHRQLVAKKYGGSAKRGPEVIVVIIVTAARRIWIQEAVHVWRKMTARRAGSICGVVAVDLWLFVISTPFLPAPTRAEQQQVAWTTCEKTMEILRERGLWLDIEPADDPFALEQPALAECAAASIAGVVTVGKRAGLRINFQSSETSGAFSRSTSSTTGARNIGRCFPVT